MARTRQRAESAAPLVNEQGDYRPREFGRITWLVKLAEREVGRELDRELRHTGLTKSQFGVLQALMHLERASSAALARTVFVTPQAMVGIVAGLERKGFIRRKSSKVSARAIDATVTASGKAVYAEAVRMIRNVDDILAAEFTGKELDQLDDFLERMIAAMRRGQSARGSRVV
ncbi:MAG TPA: MarR family transcriptional regulator [Acidimicrobiia bacterium]|nr:MarR family transcriptional regulator [Acidimicrobiia bacterium]